MKDNPEQYAHRIALDFEYQATDNGVEFVHCLCAIDEVTGQKWMLRMSELQQLDRLPFPTGDDTLLIVYAGAAEMDALRALGMELPRCDIFDCYYEFLGWLNCRQVTQDPDMSRGGILNACRLFGIDACETSHKDAMRAICIEHQVIPDEHIWDVLKYCLDDCTITLQLFRKLLPLTRNFKQAIHRGRFCEIQSSIQQHGLPVDVQAIEKLREGLPRLESIAIDKAVSAGFDIFMGSGEVSETSLAGILTKTRTPWLRTFAGHLKTDRDTFKDIAAVDPRWQPVVDVLSIQKASHTFRNGLKVGTDDRHRYFAAPLATSTGRHQPRKCLWTLPKAFRSILYPEPGWGIAILDWKSQEIGVSAGLSGDKNLLQVFTADDPYIEFAILAGALPKGATKKSHPKQRSLFKRSLLALQYGCGPKTLGLNLGISAVEAEQIHKMFQQTFDVYHSWAESTWHHGICRGELFTINGWRRGTRYDPKRDDGSVNPLSLTNFMVQGAGADILRAAAIGIGRKGIRVISTIHDAIAIEAPLETFHQDVATTEAIMARTSKALLDIPARTDVTIAVDDRYRDEDGQKLWREIATELSIEDTKETVPF